MRLQEYAVSCMFINNRNVLEKRNKKKKQKNKGVDYPAAPHGCDSRAAPPLNKKDRSTR
jgi:hypothetical protein